MKKMYMESLEGIEKKAVSDILTERGFEVLPAGEEKHGVGLSGSLDQNLNYAAFQMECRDGSVISVRVEPHRSIFIHRFHPFLNPFLFLHICQ